MVNSSQGGGTKDSFVLMDNGPSQVQSPGLQSQTMGTMTQSQGREQGV